MGGRHLLMSPPAPPRRYIDSIVIMSNAFALHFITDSMSFMKSCNVLIFKLDHLPIWCTDDLPNSGVPHTPSPPETRAFQRHLQNTTLSVL